MRRESGDAASVNWPAVLSAFCARLRTRSRSYARPNRRFPGRMGEVPGYRRRPGLPVVLAAIDTSGSMEDQILAQIADQIRHIAGLTAVVVAECDAAVQRVYRHAGRIDSVKGRGGTDLRPVFECDFLQRHQVDAVIYFTDGMGPFPASNPGIPTLWVLSGRTPFECPWGWKLRLEPAAPPREPCLRSSSAVPGL